MTTRSLFPQVLLSSFPHFFLRPSPKEILCTQILVSIPSSGDSRGLARFRLLFFFFLAVWLLRWCCVLSVAPYGQWQRVGGGPARIWASEYQGSTWKAQEPSSHLSSLPFWSDPLHLHPSPSTADRCSLPAGSTLFVYQEETCLAPLVCSSQSSSAWFPSPHQGLHA